MIQWINATKSWFFEIINKTNKMLANITKIKKKTWINRTEAKPGDIRIDTNEIQKLIWEYFENLYSSKVESKQGTDEFLDTNDSHKLNQEDINNLNKSTIRKRWRQL
jgi:hypothetical protein